MSLRVWLPLDGDLRNLGLSNINLINNGAAINNSGKIGSCYSFDGTSYLKAEGDNSIYKSTENWSFCCWLYLTAAVTGTLYTQRTAAKANCGNAIFYYGNSFIMDDGVRWQFYPKTALITNQWYHLTFVREQGVGKKLYINGILDSSTNTLGTISAEIPRIFSIGASQAGSNNINGNWLQGSLNDWRLYDHALSEKEVREIYKSLVLHYKLNDTNHKFYGDNILPNSNLMQLGSSSASIGRWRNAGTSNMTRKRVLIEKNIYGFENSGIQVANDASCYGIDSFPLKGNTIYRISMKARKISGEGDAFAGFVVYNISDEIDGSHIKVDKTYRVTPLTNEWTDCWYIVKTNANATRNIYIGITTGDTEVTTQMCQVKIQEVYEIGDSTVVEDCSGYRHNGTIVGTITTSIDTPRYDQSSVFNGSSYIAIGSQLYNMRDAMTVNLWCKKDWTQNTGTPFSSVQNGGFGWQCNGIEYTFYCGTGQTSNTYMNRVLTISTLSEGWHMLSAVYDGHDLFTYIDGELARSIHKYDTKTPLYYNQNSGMFIGAESVGYLMSSGTDRFIGNISDVRVYATALTAEDIKELYQTSATIDENGNMYARELVE